jgi:hypothetical protein
MSEQKFNFGDLVRVEGYEDRVFCIHGKRVEQFFYPGEEWTDVLYELTDVQTADWLDAFEEDLRLVIAADKADEYLKLIPKGGDEPVFDFEPIRKPKPTPENERYNKQRERERKINELLDERNDYAVLLAEFGDDKYAQKIKEIDRKLSNYAD